MTGFMGLIVGAMFSSDGQLLDKYGGRYWDRTSDPYDVKVAGQAKMRVNARDFAGRTGTRTGNGG